MSRSDGCKEIGEAVPKNTAKWPEVCFVWSEKFRKLQETKDLLLLVSWKLVAGPKENHGS